LQIIHKKYLFIILTIITVLGLCIYALLTVEVYKPVDLPKNAICELTKEKIEYGVQLHPEYQEQLFFSSFENFLNYIKKDNYKFNRAYIMDYNDYKINKKETWITVWLAYYVEIRENEESDYKWVGFNNRNDVNNFLKNIKSGSKIKLFQEIQRELRVNNNKK